MQGGLGWSQVLLLALWTVLSRTHRIEDYRHSEDDQREDHPVKEDDDWMEGNEQKRDGQRLVDKINYKANMQ